MEEVLKQLQVLHAELYRTPKDLGPSLTTVMEGSELADEGSDAELFQDHQLLIRK
jgi:hypothetical protein